MRRCACGHAHPCRLRIAGKPPAVGVHLAEGCVPFVKHHRQSGRFDDLVRNRHGFFHWQAPRKTAREGRFFGWCTQGAGVPGLLAGRSPPAKVQRGWVFHWLRGASAPQGLACRRAYVEYPEWDGLTSRRPRTPTLLNWLIRSALGMVLVTTTRAKQEGRSRTPGRERCERREVFPSAAADGELYPRCCQFPDQEVFCWLALSRIS